MEQYGVRITRLLAHLLDDVIRIPGTSIRIGLDPLIGLIPGLGDAIAGVAGTVILFLASQQHVPKIVLVRMGMNIAINSALGAVPLVGDLFSAWFKSNLRNLNLLERHSVVSGRQSTTFDWIFVIGLISAVVILVGGVLIGVMWLLRRIWQMVQ